jgi:DNA processing protein
LLENAFFEETEEIMSSLKHWIWLSSIDGLGAVSALKILNRFGNAADVYKATTNEFREIPGLKTAQISQLAEKDLSKANKILALCEQIGCSILTINDSNYPERLKNIYDPPLVLYLKGRLPVIDDEAAVAIVGTRRCTPYGVKTAEELGNKLAKSGFVIVTGLAKGIDTAAARGALRAGGRVVGVIGTGVDVVYPAENKSVFEDVLKDGAIVSEYPPKTLGHKTHFPARNRIISGLSLGVAVLESPKRSGALITAARALEQNREVFAMPGNVDAVSCAGSNLLLREGAIPVLSADDIISEYIEKFPDKIILADENTSTAKNIEDNSFTSELRPRREKELKRAESENCVDNMRLVEYIDLGKIIDTLSGDEKAVAEVIGIDDSVHIDEIITQTELSASQVLAALTMLELQGIAQNTGGNCFILKASNSE